MGRFLIKGISKATGRTQVQIYDALDKEHAIMMAASEGLVVEANTIESLPDEPATVNQIEYAKKLGIKAATTISKKELSDMITKAEDEDWPRPAQTKKAKRLGIKLPKNITGDELDDLIFDRENEMKDEKERRREENEDRKYKVQTIEKTGKKYKGFVFISCLMMFGGIILAAQGKNPGGILLIFFGLFFLILAKLGAWWSHG